MIEIELIAEDLRLINENNTIDEIVGNNKIGRVKSWVDS